MKHAALVLVILCCFASSAKAFEFTETDTKILHLCVYALIDYEQSTDMFYHREGYRELNPLLGEYPEKEDLMLFGASGVALLYGVSKVLPDGRLKSLIIDSVLATEKFNIEENRRAMRYGERMFDTIMLVVKFEF